MVEHVSISYTVDLRHMGILNEIPSAVGAGLGARECVNRPGNYAASLTGDFIG